MPSPPTSKVSAVILLAVPAVLLAATLATGPGAARKPCSPHAAGAGWSAPDVAGNDDVDFRSLVARLSELRLVFVGESHDRFDHHLNQLEVICAMAADSQPLAVGMEFFQRPFQEALDRYAGTHHDLDRLLQESEYFRRWGFDPRLYAPILEFAAQHGIQLIALNPSAETVAKVSLHGPDGLDDEQAARLRAAVLRVTPGYEARLRAAFEAHPGHEDRNFQRFLAVQVLWDETMARGISEYLRREPMSRMVVLAGGGHVDHADAVPGRVRGIPAERMAMVVQTREKADGAPAAYALRSQPLELPPPGRLGVVIASEGSGVQIGGFAPDSAGRDAGLQAGDRLLSIDGADIASMSALRLAMWRKRAGDLVDLDIARDDITRSMRFALR